MSEAIEIAPGTVPEWLCQDRMRKAREHAGLKQADLGPLCGISRTAAVDYESGRTLPGRKVLLAWSMATGVPYQWLCHGDLGPCGEALAATRPGAHRVALAEKMHCMPTNEVA